MREVQDDKKPWRVHLKRLVEMGRRPVEELEGPEVPDAVEYLWDWLLELDGMRHIGMNGPEPFTPEMVEAWARMSGNEVTPAEFRALVQLGFLLQHPPPEDDD